jgi:hypothetical protein
MRSIHRPSLLVALLLVSIGWPTAAQVTPSAPAPIVLAPAEMEKFLLNAKVLAKKDLSKGVTKAQRLTLSDGVVTHYAHMQDVDISMPFFNVDPKHTEVGFKDSYRYNVAAYRVAMQLGLDNVPMSVERTVDRVPAVTWWLEGVMDEADRRKKKIEATNHQRTDSYYHVMRVFDELIQNRDRNAGNIMWTSDDRMWMIDHTRAFRLGKALQKPEALHRVDRTLLEKLRALDRKAVAEAVGRTLTKDEIDAMFVRRDLIVKLFDERIAARGEAAVLYALQ